MSIDKPTVKRIQSVPESAPKIVIYTRVMEGVVEKKEGKEVYELIGVEEVKVPETRAPARAKLVDRDLDASLEEKFTAAMRGGGRRECGECGECRECGE